MTQIVMWIFTTSTSKCMSWSNVNGAAHIVSWLRRKGTKSIGGRRYNTPFKTVGFKKNANPERLCFWCHNMHDMQEIFRRLVSSIHIAQKYARLEKWTGRNKAKSRQNPPEKVDFRQYGQYSENMNCASPWCLRVRLLRCMPGWTPLVDSQPP